MMKTILFNRRGVSRSLGMFAIGLTAAILITGTPVIAHDHEGHDHWETRTPEQEQAHDKAYDAIMTQAGLSTAQIQKIRATRQQARTEAKSMKSQIHQLHETLMTYLKSPAADEAHASGLQDHISKLETRLDQHRIQTLFAMRRIMTPEQFKKFIALRESAHLDHPPHTGNNHS